MYKTRRSTGETVEREWVCERLSNKVQAERGDKAEVSLLQARSKRTKENEKGASF